MIMSNARLASMEEAHLVKAEHHFDRAHELIVCQQQRLERLRARGLDTSAGSALLEAMWSTLAIMRRHREVVLRAIHSLEQQPDRREWGMGSPSHEYERSPLAGAAQSAR